MEFPDGIPMLAAVEEARSDDELRDMLRYSDAFLESARHLTRRYRWGPGINPLRNWSRRWEYPFVWQRLQRHAAERGSGALSILDAGSGVTFFPYYLGERLPGAQVTCCDYNPSYGRLFERINALRGQAAVDFAQADLRRLPFHDGRFDALYCVSVLEHTGDYERILDEFLRVLRPGGLAAITFDISLDRRCEIHPEEARALVAVICQRFGLPPAPHLAELDRLSQADAILTTDHVRATEPDLLPWRHPLLKSLYDLLHGRGWTGGFFSLTCYCLAAHAPRGAGET